MRKKRILAVCARSEKTRNLSYHFGWPYHLSRHPAIDLTVFDLLDDSIGGRVSGLIDIRFKSYDAILVLHSSFSNVSHLRPAVIEALSRHSCPKAYFIGNEYKHMPEKIAAARGIGATLFITMNFNPDVVALYRNAVGCKVMSMSSGALDETRFFPGPPLAERPIDLGFRGFDEPVYFGHQERSEVSTAARAIVEELGMLGDISMDPKDRVADGDWAEFLRSCRAQLGTHSGHDYFEIDDRTRKATIQYQAEQPGAAFEDIRKKFFSDYPNPVRARMITGRHIEAAGTRTVQVLPEGEYSGYFQAGIHYIPFKTDLSDIRNAIERIRDFGECERIARSAEELVKSELTYEKSIGRILSALAD